MISVFWRRHLHTLSVTSRLDIKTNQHPLGVGKVAYDLSDRLGQLPDERRNSKYLISARQGRVLHQVNYFDEILSFQILFTDLLQVLEGGERARSLPGNVETQVPTRGIFGLRRLSIARSP